VAPTPAGPVRLSLAEVVAEVRAGKWGNGDDRKNRLVNAGYDFQQIQDEINGRPAPEAPARKSNEDIAQEVLRGMWGNGPERSRKLQAAGYSPTAIQDIVNGKMGGGTTSVRLSNTELARQVLKGQWGNGPERQRRITAAGYDYPSVQREVNRLS
jgi:N-acetylmuramoyl-L-alanine amidase